MNRTLRKLNEITYLNNGVYLLGRTRIDNKVFTALTNIPSSLTGKVSPVNSRILTGILCELVLPFAQSYIAWRDTLLNRAISVIDGNEGVFPLDNRSWN